MASHFIGGVEMSLVADKRIAVMRGTRGVDRGRKVTNMQSKKIADAHRKEGEDIDENVKYRLQFDLTAESLKKLDELVKLTSASSRAEVVRRALTLLRNVADAESRGLNIMLVDSRDPDDVRKRQMLWPIL